MVGARQSEVLDAVAHRTLAERLVNAQHLVDGDIPNGVGGNPPARLVRLTGQHQEFFVVETQDAACVGMPVGHA